MARFSVFLGVLLTFLPGSGAATVTVLEPIRATGDEVGLIFIPELFMEGEQYRSTARAIQAASHLRLWVALAPEFQKGTVGSASVLFLVKDSVNALEKAGMKSKDFVGVGHGSGGYFLHDYAQYPSPLKALVLMGGCLPRSTKLQDYPLPVLTLAAELDGITRITRVAEEYDKLKQDLKTSYRALYKTPVILVEGANHGQFASGSIPFQIEDKDLIPDATLSPGLQNPHVITAKHVSNFLTANFATSVDMREVAKAGLEEAFSNSNQKLQPFLDIRELDVKGNFSRWTVLAQEYFAEEFTDDIQIKNQIGGIFSFFNSKPSIRIDNGAVVVETITLVDHGNKGNNMEIVMESPVEMNMKLKTKDAIWKAVVKQNNRSHLDGPSLSLKGEPETCKSLNEFALEIALKHSSQAARDRYKSRGRPIIFEDDTVVRFGFMWTPTPLKTWEDDDGLHVQAIARVEPDNGLHYCKVITPYRAMEWINVDSLRKY